MTHKRLAAAAALTWLLSSGCRATTAPQAPGPALATESGEGVPNVDNLPEKPFLQKALGLDRLFQDLLDDLEKDPQFVAAGNRLFDRLGRHPVVGRRASGLLEGVTESPAFERWLERELAASADPTQFEAALDKRVDAVFDHPQFDKAFDQALDVLFERPVVDQAIRRWVERTVRLGRVNPALAALVLSPRWRPGWEGLVGRQPTAAALVVRVDHYLDSPAGERAAWLLGQSLIKDPQLRRLFLRALETPALEGVVAEALGPLLEDKPFCDRLAGFFLRLLTGTPAPALASEVRGVLLDVPAPAQAIASFFDRLGAADTISTQIGQDLRDLILRLRDREDVRRAIFGVATAGAPASARAW